MKLLTSVNAVATKLANVRVMKRESFEIMDTVNSRCNPEEHQLKIRISSLTGNQDTLSHMGNLILQESTEF